MTTHIPSLTLPGEVFAQPAVSILLPMALGTSIGFIVRRTLHAIDAFRLLAHAAAAKETQKTYMALKQPPYRPPPQVFGPVWTTLYGLMGYSAYRAWDTGMSSLNPNVVALTKVQLPLLLLSDLQANTWPL